MAEQPPVQEPERAGESGKAEEASPSPRTAGLEVNLVTETAACRNIVELLCQKHTEVGLDCEGEQLSRLGKLTLVQLIVEKTVYIFDVTTNPELVSVLKPVLEGPIIKIIHDCRQDSDALYHQHGIILSNVFDTQIGDAVLKRQRWETHPHYNPTRPFIEPLPISYRKLLQNYCSVTIDKQGIRDKMNEDQSFWSQRPLTAEAVQYAAADVFYLPLVFRVMRDSLSAAYWEMAMIRSAIYLDEYRSNEYGPEIFREKLRMRSNRNYPGAVASVAGTANGSGPFYYYRDNAYHHQHHGGHPPYHQPHLHDGYAADYAAANTAPPYYSNGTSPPRTAEANAASSAAGLMSSSPTTTPPITRQITFNPNAPVFQPRPRGTAAAATQSQPPLAAEPPNSSSGQ